MDATLARELKLDAPPAFALARVAAQLDAFVAAPAELTRLHAIAYDTEDLRLARWGVSLRYCLPGGWGLKLPRTGGCPALREERRFPGGPRTIPATALELLTAYLRGAVPRPVAELRTLRQCRRVSDDDGRELGTIVQEDVRVVAGCHVVNRFRHLEIALAADAPEDVLEQLAAALRGAGAGGPDDRPDGALALGLGTVPPPLPPVEVPAGARAGELFRAAFADAVETLIRLDSALREGGEDPEPVHDARVALRRMRSHLRTFRPILEEPWAEGLRERLRWLSDRLAAARDADVMLARLRSRGGDLPAIDRPRLADVLAPLAAARAAAYATLSDTLREARYVALLDELVAAAARPRLRGADPPAADVAATIVAGPWRSLCTSVRKRTRPPTDDQLHRIRIKAKRARYAAEAFAPWAGERAEAFARRLARLQTILGDQHDAVVAQAQLRADRRDPEAAFVAGELAALEHADALAARHEWRAAWRAAKHGRPRFW